MSHSREHLIEQFRLSRDYREGFAEEFLNTCIASQINVVRKQRGLMTQEQLGDLIGMKQAGISRIENVNYGKWNVGTLRRIANALGTRLKVSLETYGTLLDEALGLSTETLMRSSFEEDPVFCQQSSSIGSRPPDWEVEGPIGWMRQLLLPWLESPKWEAVDFIDWLQGRGLPAVGDHDEPYRWFLRAIPEEPPWAEYRKELVRRVARVLWDEPDRHRPGRRPEEFLSNLFLLAAGLDSPDMLATPLYPVFERLRDKKTNPGADERDCLLAALTRNQADVRLYEVWMEMLNTGKHPVLPGNEFAGFSGLKWLPPRPNVPAMGLGLKILEKRFYQREDKVAVFSDLLEGVLAAYRSDPDLASKLVGQAFSTAWTEWSLEAWAMVFGSGDRVAALMTSENGDLVRGVLSSNYSARTAQMRSAGADEAEISTLESEHREFLTEAAVVSA